MPEQQPQTDNTQSPPAAATDYVLEGILVPDLTHTLVLKHAAAEAAGGVGSSFDIYPTFLDVNSGAFASAAGSGPFPAVVVTQGPDTVRLSCNCPVPKTLLCPHMAQV